MKVTAYGAVYDFGPMIKELIEFNKPEVLLMELHDLIVNHFTYSSESSDLFALCSDVFVAQVIFGSLREVIKQKEVIKEEDL